MTGDWWEQWLAMTEGMDAEQHMDAWRRLAINLADAHPDEAVSILYDLQGLDSAPGVH